MRDLDKIKRKLIKEEKIEDLLESIGCEHIKPEQRGGLITAQLPEKFQSPNKRSVQVRINDNLSSHIRSMGDFKGGDIFSLVSYINHDKRGEDIVKDLYNSKKYICELFGWNYFLSDNRSNKKTIDYTAPLKALMGRRKKRRNVTNPVLSESVMDNYYFYNKPLPYQDWVDEGISHNTQIMYGVGFDLDSKRVVFPIKNRFGDIVGVKGRIMKDEDDDRKYIYVHPCNNGYEWFNFNHALPSILEEKVVFVFEAEKSCMKAHSLDIDNTLAIGASDITDIQANTLKNIGLDIRIVLCYDKGITENEILEQAKLLEGREVYYLYDRNDTLEDKNSPIDQGLDDWLYLLKNNIYKVDYDNLSLTNV